MDLYRYEKHTYRTSYVFYLYKTNLTRRVDRSRYTKIRGDLFDGNKRGLKFNHDALRCVEVVNGDPLVTKNKISASLSIIAGNFSCKA